jgi:hypothetical protein
MRLGKRGGIVLLAPFLVVPAFAQELKAVDIGRDAIAQGSPQANCYYSRAIATAPVNRRLRFEPSFEHIAIRFRHV